MKSVFQLRESAGEQMRIRLFLSKITGKYQYRLVLSCGKERYQIIVGLPGRLGPPRRWILQKDGTSRSKHPIKIGLPRIDQLIWTEKLCSVLLSVVCYLAQSGSARIFNGSGTCIYKTKLTAKRQRSEVTVIVYPTDQESVQNRYTCIYFLEKQF